MRDLLPRDEIHARLFRIFPRDAFDPVHSNMLAASALALMLYVDSVVPETGLLPDDAAWARPSMCLWMRDGVYAHEDADERTAWRLAALVSRKASAELEASWGVPNGPAWYADNSRETLRDETFPAWLDHGALRDRPGLATTSSRPRWALAAAFADLFDPALEGDALDNAIDAWRATHMSPGDRFRIATLRERDRAGHAVVVRLPGGETRSLEPGVASTILRGVLEQWAPARLSDPVVLTISEPGDKVYVVDESRLRSLGLTIDTGNLLPDAVIVDIAQQPPTFWIVEAVATDGPVSEDRRRQLLRWAEEQRIPGDSCRFLTAFLDRNDSIAKRRLKDLAADTFAWFAAEPSRELAWYEIGDVEGEGRPKLT
jgi:BsuBI/PstI restriction endonuclease domain/BsuBI/PstI restriction endonuclease HTH domain